MRISQTFRQALIIQEASFRPSSSCLIFSAIWNMESLEAGLVCLWELLYILQYKDYMLFTARSRKSMRPNHSGSKDSKESNIGRKPEKIQNVSLADLKLRQAINLKYEKSKTKYYKCTKIVSGFDQEKSDHSNSSLNSIDMPQYAPLLHQRYINLKEYHKKPETTPQNKQYLIKFRRSDYRKTIKTQQNNQSSSKLYTEAQNKIFYQDFNANTFIKNQAIFEGSYKERKTLSGDKKESEWKKLGFNYHSSTKSRNGSHKRAPSQQEQPKSRLYYFRKKNKSPQSKYV